MEGIRERIHREIDGMDIQELLLLYNQIKLIKSMKRRAGERKGRWSLDEIHELTSSSKSSWAEAVISEREEGR
ncbi:hypothetical protein DRP77_12980 [Candidatus Poribacteria bacterium]|nr:MAG: hypothetical protein DRP77_12980 [Candidatus Poribacteria bacterium]